MADVNPTTTVTATATKRPRIKDALALGICDTTKAGTRIINGTADVVEAVAVRVKLHNIAVAADIIDELGGDKVSAAQQLIKNL